MVTRYDANEDEVPSYQVGYAAAADDPWIRIDGGDLPCGIAIRLGAPRAGRIVCTGLHVGAEGGEEQYEVTARMLRGIHLSKVLRMIREAGGTFGKSYLTAPPASFDPALREWLAERFGEAVALDYESVAGKTTAEVFAGKTKTLSVRRGRKGLDPETLRRTAEVYQRALAAGSTQPLAVAAEALDIHPSTVWRRLQKAWQRFPELAPTEKGGAAK